MENYRPIYKITGNYKTPLKITGALLILFGACSVIYTALYHWAKSDDAAVCQALGYQSSVTEHGWPPVGYCVIRHPGVDIRHPVIRVYRRYINQVRRDAAAN